MSTTPTELRVAAGIAENLPRTLPTHCGQPLHKRGCKCLNSLFIKQGLERTFSTVVPQRRNFVHDFFVKCPHLFPLRLVAIHSFFSNFLYRMPICPQLFAHCLQLVCATGFGISSATPTTYHSQKDMEKARFSGPEECGKSFFPQPEGCRQTLFLQPEHVEA